MSKIDRATEHVYEGPFTLGPRPDEMHLWSWLVALWTKNQGRRARVTVTFEEDAAELRKARRK